jgi:hypothetical protein
MKSLSQTINEKLKIRKSTSNIKRFELYSEIEITKIINTKTKDVLFEGHLIATI